jgi:hypothetical protein
MNSINLRALGFLILACTLSFSGLLHGQGNFAEFPYNPDANGDDFVGTSDLLALLNLYGSEFSEEGLYLNEDSTAAIVHVGSLAYPKCAHQCRSLSGNWRIATLEDLGMIWEIVAPPSSEYSMWLGDRLAGSMPQRLFSHPSLSGPTIIPQSNQVISGGVGDLAQCYCSTIERPRVEYSYCIGAGGENIQPCFDEKKNNGWYPHGSLEFRPDGSPAQGFWRWAE